MLNELGAFLERKIGWKRDNLKLCKEKNQFAKCLRLEGEIHQLETMYEELASRQLLFVTSPTVKRRKNGLSSVTSGD